VYVRISTLEFFTDNSLYKFTFDIDIDMYFIMVLYFWFCVGLFLLLLFFVHISANYCLQTVFEMTYTVPGWKTFNCTHSSLTYN